ncbi:sel1 repeat family protein [Phyllobacterium sp. 628]|uniref:tetratricopeptide repeat protein n=1 Tax=Phyllobacterium sp. 628 TaxID=2718938 RepID=UPI00166235B9|nr:tetratricopeptide repeat protein [Phyllobacterium sp. 628]QND51413.1 sel1 repeat family protein [Phyllobacterium sp. 628]
MDWLLFSSDDQTDIDDARVHYDDGDFSAALKLWSLKAMDGDPAAQNNFGVLHARGEGVEQDSAEAAQWFRKAAAQDLATAHYNLGLMTARGEGVPRDKIKGAEWVRKAAQLGHTKAQAILGHLYVAGDQGVPLDLAEAAKWYRKAAKQGHEGAARSLIELYAANPALSIPTSELLD